MPSTSGPITGKTATSRGASAKARLELAMQHHGQAIALAQQGRFAEAEACCREALRIRPGDADLLNELGMTLWQQRRPLDAEAAYRRACQLRPNDYRTLNNLGMVLYEQHRMDEAAECYRQALRIKADGYQAITNLAVVLSDQGMFDDALKWLNRALELEPQAAHVLQNIGMNLARQGRWHEAIEYYQKALARDPGCAEVHRNLAYALLSIGDYERGWVEYEWRLRCQPHPGYQINRTRWTGENLPDSTILLHVEQGYGDILQFLRFAPLVKRRVGRVLVLAPPALLQLAARCDGVDMAFTAGTYTPVCHVHAPLMSLPAIFGTTLATVPANVPYLATDQVLVDHWGTVLAKTIGEAGAEPTGSPHPAGLREQARPFSIGIAWQGSTTSYMDRWRSFPLASFAPLAELPGVRLISLQVGHGREQLDSLQGSFPVIELPGRRGRDFMETAAIMSHLDLVITPDTSVAHLAGALGLRAWIGLSTIDEWRWLAGGEQNAWYPTVRRFRQTSLGHWDDVFQQMANALKNETQRSGAAA